MPYLRFDTDQGRDAVAKLRQIVENMRVEAESTHTDINALVGSAWVAPAAYEFQNLASEWQQTLTGTLERLSELSTRLDAEIAEWEETAAVFGGADGGAGSASASATSGEKSPSSSTQGGSSNNTSSTEWRQTYQKMSWSKLTAEKEIIEKQLAQARQNHDEKSIAELQSKLDVINSRLDKGITPVPSSKAYQDSFKGGGCTEHVAKIRQVEWSGNAGEWNENAKAAGYDVGTVPVKGSIIVFEKDASYVQTSELGRQYGHVAYVKNISEESGQYKITISENGNNNHTIYVNKSEIDAGKISFIYDKLPEN